MHDVHVSSEAAPAAARAAAESGPAEAGRNWAPDEEAMQAASALAELAGSAWAGTVSYHSSLVLLFGYMHLQKVCLHQ